MGRPFWHRWTNHTTPRHSSDARSAFPPLRPTAITRASSLSPRFHETVRPPRRRTEPERTMVSARKGRGAGGGGGVVRSRPRIDGGGGGSGSLASRVAVLAFCVAGIWSAYITQGVLQETLSTKRFGPEARRFDHLAFLNFAQNVVCFVWSFIMIKLWSGGSSPAGRAPLSKYWGVSITNTIGPTMGIEALKYISYPAQVLAKSSKMIPVMLMGTLLYGVKYTLPEYFCTFLVAGGVSSFALLKTSSKTIKKLANPNAPLGYALCFLNLAFDGYTNSTQDLIKSRFPKTNPWDIMLGMNLWGTIYNTVIMFVAPLLFSSWPYANGFEAVKFCQENPEVAWDILMFCLCGAVGQNFIFLTISRFGSLTNTTITTTRKFMSIVISSVISGNPLSFEQWGSVVMVFSGLSLQIYLKWKRKKGREHKE
ncbi:UDP-galactose/UDP-glucose transporter 3 [Lolium perenne]|uniref:UDP-galactose/UDP-glucose transporter 3 n=1 Tax=Lolium perenne TaxID=4522 RepID=UPI0021F58B09|nr:UDP-galactose/UDP-glucose transporter 3-like [Lolium perenne]